MLISKLGVAKARRQLEPLRKWEGSVVSGVIIKRKHQLTGQGR